MKKVKLVKGGYTVEVYEIEVKGYLADGWKKVKSVKSRGK